MRGRKKGTSSSETLASASSSGAVQDDGVSVSGSGLLRAPRVAKRSLYALFSLFAIFVYASWSVYHNQYEKLPLPLSAEQAGKRGFSEFEAVKHVTALAELGPHPVGSAAIDRALQYVRAAAEKIKNTSHWDVDVEVQQFHVKSGANILKSGLFAGKTVVYADLDHIILRISPKYTPEARDHSILVSSHIDTVSTTGGAGDCSSCVGVILELARGVSQWAHGFKSSVIFLLNMGEEEGLNGAHSFITQHPWSETVHVAVDLEAMGIGGKSSIFQAGPHPWAVETFASAAKYPSANVMAQDLFSAGAIKSATDFQVYKELAGLSGLDFAFTDNTAVYHTKNDKLDLLKPGSLQHLGENMLAFLLQAASSPELTTSDASSTETNDDDDSATYFDILGSYMIVYRRRFANMLHNSVIIQSLSIWAMSLFMGGGSAAIALALSCLSVVLMWIFSLSFSVLSAFILSSISLSSVPYLSSPWLVIGLFGIPSLMGALAGQHLGFVLLQKYLSRTYAQGRQKLSPSTQATLAKLEAERWLFKSGTVQWLLLMVVANYYKVASSYIPLVWLVTPAFSYGLLEATLSPIRFPKPLKFVTLLMALSVPTVVSVGGIIRLIGVLIGTVVRFDRNPGSAPEWLGNVIVSIIIAGAVCLMLVYLLSYVHLSGAKRSIILVSAVLFGLSLAAVRSGIIPAYTDDISRAVNVVHIVDTIEAQDKGEDVASSYVTLFSFTPGKLTSEVEQIKEGFECGREKELDLVTFSVKYGCRTYDETESGWSKADIPEIVVKSDVRTDENLTVVSIDTKASRRWALKINTEEVEDFEFRVAGDLEELVPMGQKSSVDNWHQIQYSGGKNAPTKFELSLLWAQNSTRLSGHVKESKEKYVLKLRTDVDRLTPKAESVLQKLPSWCTQFGKSTSPYTLAFLTGLRIEQ